MLSFRHFHSRKFRFGAILCPCRSPVTQHLEEAVGPWWRMNEPRGCRSDETGLRFGLRQSRKQHRVDRTTGGRRGNRARLTVRPRAFKEDKCARAHLRRINSTQRCHFIKKNKQGNNRKEKWVRGRVTCRAGFVRRLKPCQHMNGVYFYQPRACARRAHQDGPAVRPDADGSHVVSARSHPR